MQKYNVITFGIESDAQFKAVDIKEENGSTSFDVKYSTSKIIDETDGPTVQFSSSSQHISIPTIGIHNVYNALAAFTVGTSHEASLILRLDFIAQSIADTNRIIAPIRQSNTYTGNHREFSYRILHFLCHRSYGESSISKRELCSTI